jgi:hypothetical protein
MDLVSAGCEIQRPAGTANAALTRDFNKRPNLMKLT